MLLLLYLLRNTNYFRYVIFVVLFIILYKLSTYKTNKENFTGFKCKKEKYAYCDTIEQVGKFCKKNKSHICKEYNAAFNKTRQCLNKIIIQADGSSFSGPATSNKRPKL